MIPIKFKLIFWVKVILGLSLILNYFLYRQFKDEKQSRKRWENNYISTVDSLTVFKTKSGAYATQAKQLHLTVRELKNIADNKDTLIARLYHTIKDQDKKIKNIKSALFVAIQANGGGIVEKIPNNENNLFKYKYVFDSVGCNHYRYDDNYLYLELLACSDDSLELQYRYSEDITVITDLTKEPLNKWWHYLLPGKWFRSYVDRTTITTSNPETKIKIATHVNIIK